MDKEQSKELTVDKATLSSQVQEMLAEIDDDVELQQEYLSALEESKEGVKLQLPVLTISKESPVFYDSEKDAFPEIVGIILDSHRINAFDSEKGRMPRCYSYDGVASDEAAEDIQARYCSKCSKSRFGSAGEGSKAMACKHRRRIIIMQEDGVPMRITIPPTSLKFYDEYVSKLLTKYKKPIPITMAVTKITLELVENDYIYNVVHFELVRLLTVQEWQETKDARTTAKGLRHDKIVDEDYDDTPFNNDDDIDLEPLLDENGNPMLEDDVPF